MRRTNVEYSSKCRAEYCTATFAKRVLYAAFSLFEKYFLKMFVYSKIRCKFVIEIKNYINGKSIYECFFWKV